MGKSRRYIEQTSGGHVETPLNRYPPPQWTITRNKNEIEADLPQSEGFDLTAKQLFD